MYSISDLFATFVRLSGVYLSIKIGMSDRFAYSAPPTAAVSLGVARSATGKGAQRRDDTERSEVSACFNISQGCSQKHFLIGISPSRKAKEQYCTYRYLLNNSGHTLLMI